MIPDLTVGDSERPWIDVHPYEIGSTQATLALHSPDDPDETGTDVPLDSGVEAEVDGLMVLRFAATSLVRYAAPRWWVKSWKIIGVGASEPFERFFVARSPLAGGPEWTPTRARVASYVPSRPLVPAPDGSNVDLMTFDATTRPTGAQVDLHIADAVRWVTDATGELDAVLHESATAVAAIRAAAFVELGYGERDKGMRDTANQTSDRLFKQADQMLAALAARNEALTGVDPAVFEVMPVYSFPSPSPYGDRDLP
ncbi:hypothetical protein Dfulv_17175 [Dactylosporangium fulvum]|uniref:Uncharacterized protein n=1 Tax=Dactylosporangium fulvum TaxID=53359 RepID=A0ABY5W928_9ACTN|nr:hypothetical protein [Dactylosporangium fulvum]UWP85880.1 hypothetical protein Dfulv_17175 [Dactylosporangium fulvum]